MTNIVDKIEYLRQLLPKYTINKSNCSCSSCISGGNVAVQYDKIYNTHNAPIDYFIKHMILIKFIHDNCDYFIEMLLSNGFEYSEKCYKRNGVCININFDKIITDKYYSDPETMYDDLRKIIEIEIPYKYVMNE